MLIIHREGIMRDERAVRITDGRGGLWYINPERELYHATGIGGDRHRCIVSFADGLVAGGHNVLMDFRFLDGLPQIVQHHLSHWLVPKFFLIGLAFGKNSLPSLRSTLMTYVAPERRLAVFKYNAERYAQMPAYELGGASAIKLLLP